MSFHCPVHCAHIRNRDLGVGVGGERKGVLGPHRHTQSDPSALRPLDHTEELSWPEIFSCLRSTRV